MDLGGGHGIARQLSGKSQVTIDDVPGRNSVDGLSLWDGGYRECCSAGG